MITLGIESSCDECAAALLEGKTVLSSVTASQTRQHAAFQGVAPEVASRLHIELVLPTVKAAFGQAGLQPQDIGLVAFANRPGLLGSLLVGVSFGKHFAWALGKPFIGVDHVQAHLHSAHLVYDDIAYPYLGIVASGGHTVIVKAESFDDIEVIGSTIDDALGECYDKVAKHYNWGYPGGPAVEKLAQSGDESAYNFPYPNLYKEERRYDMSYSGLKNAAVNQSHQFHVAGKAPTPQNLAASFQKAAIGQLVSKVKKALADFGLQRIVMGGGVAANAYLRQRLQGIKNVSLYAPPPALCGDNADMTAFLGTELFKRGHTSPLTEGAFSRVNAFKRGLKPSRQTEP